MVPVELIFWRPNDLETPCIALAIVSTSFSVDLTLEIFSRASALVISLCTYVCVCVCVCVHACIYRCTAMYVVIMLNIECRVLVFLMGAICILDNVCWHTWYIL